MADMTRKEIRAYCESGENCLTCQFSECIYDGAAYADRGRQLAEDKDIAAWEKDSRARRLAAYQRAYYEANKDKLAETQRIIFDFRKAAGLSQAAFGRKLGVSQRTISRWEAGEVPCRWDLLETVFPGITERSVA